MEAFQLKRLSGMGRHGAPLAAIVAASATPLLAGCDGETRTAEYPPIGPVPYEAPPDARAFSQVQDSAGVRIVRNGGVGAWGAGLARLDSLVRIGEVQSEGPYQFRGVSSMAWTPDGGLAVAERFYGRLRLYDSEGRFVRTIGRPGEGPGEFENISSLWFAGDTLYTVDSDQGRVTAFDVEGGILEEWRTYGRGLPIRSTRAGWYARLPLEEARDSRRCSGPRVDAALVHYVRSHHYARWDLESARAGPEVLVLRPGDGPEEDAESRLCLPFRRNLSSFGLDAEGRFYVTSLADYRVRILGPDGDLERIVARSYEPRRIGRADEEELKDRWWVFGYRDELGDIEDLWYPRWLQRWGARHSARAVARSIEESLDEAPPPDFAPPLGDLVVDPAGGFWVERRDQIRPGALEYVRWRLFAASGEERRPVHETRWDVFDPDGRFLTTVDLPPGFEPLAVRGTEVTGVLRDELDIEYVARYRIHPPSPSRTQPSGSSRGSTNR